MRNREQPPSLSGEILSSAAPDPFLSPQAVDRPAHHLPTAQDFSGILNIGPRLRAWGQTRGMESLAKAIDSYTVAVQSKERLARAMIEAELVEARLSQVDKLKAAAVIDVEMKLRAQEAELEEQRHVRDMRMLSRELEKEELSLKLVNARFRRQREEAKLSGQGNPDKGIAEQIGELSEQLIATQRELTEGEAAGRLSEAEVYALQIKITGILRKLEKLRDQDESE